MKNRIVPAMFAALLSLSAWAQQGVYDPSGPVRWANIESVTEAYEVVELPARRVCSGGGAVSDRPRSATPEIVGAIVGAVVGNEIHGDGAIGEVAGAALGASVARDIHNRNRQGGAGGCRMEVPREQRLVGYDVRYEYDGASYVARMQRRPVGGRLQVEVRAVPLGP